jgi:putative flippase GtrA
MVAYITNILWVFEGGKYHFIIEILMFYAVSGISAFLGTMLMGFLINRFGILTTYAFGSNIFTAVMINYAVRKFFIFHG